MFSNEVSRAVASLWSSTDLIDTALSQTGAHALLADKARWFFRTDAICVFRRKERVQFDKVRVVAVSGASGLISVSSQITTRIDKLCYGLDMNHVNPIELV
jgi:hypothetical protein